MGSQKKHHGGGIPGSLSGGIAHNSGEVTKTTFSVSTAAWPHVLLSLCLSLPPHPSGALHPAGAVWQSPEQAENKGTRRGSGHSALLCVLFESGLFCGGTRRLASCHFFSPKVHRRCKRNSGITHFLDVQAENCEQHSS